MLRKGRGIPEKGKKEFKSFDKLADGTSVRARLFDQVEDGKHGPAIGARPEKSVAFPYKNG
jgi:hypothetical protein